MRQDLAVLDAYLQGLYDRNKLPGISVAMWGPDGEALAKGYGYASADETRACDADTVYGIASMSKSQTTLACAMLAVEGKLSFEDPVYKYFPDFRVPGAARDAVQLRHLAMHTAGIPPMEPLEWSIAMHSEKRDDDWITALQKTAPNPFDTIDQVIAYIANCEYPTLGAPGEVMSYCNEGYALLSYVVDQAAGMTLEAFLQERVYGPLGMTRTVLDVDASEAIKMAGGNITSLFERDDEGKLSCDDEWSVLPPYRGCGLVKSTARDMAAYYRCLSNYGMHEGVQVIPREAVEMMAGRGFATQRVPMYAYGLYKREKNGHVICEHSGGLHGVSSHGGFLLGEGWGFAALCNLSGVDADDFVWGMYNAVMGLPLAESHRWYAPVGRDFSDPEMVVGLYRSMEGIPADVLVFVREGQLMARKAEKDMALTYCGDTFFVAYGEEDKVLLRLEAFIRNGKAWGVRCGSRVYGRVEEKA